jgi:hypothetical protein
MSGRCRDCGHALDDHGTVDDRVLALAVVEGHTMTGICSVCRRTAGVCA